MLLSSGEKIKFPATNYSLFTFTNLFNNKMAVVHFKSNRIGQSFMMSQYLFHLIPDDCSFDLVLPGVKFPTDSKHPISVK